MKDEKIIEIAQKLGYAKSTVSRAVRHCSGVDSETRRLILSHMDKTDITAPKGCPLYAILPDTPNYFWGKLHDGIEAAAKKYGLKLKVNLYTNISDCDLVLRYLEEAETVEPQVLMITANVTPEIKAKLTEQIHRRNGHLAVFFLTENADMPYTYYFGADSYEDGFRMGQYYCEHYTDYTPVVLCIKDIVSNQLRMEGFREAIRQKAPAIYDRILVKDYPVDLIHAGRGQLAPSRLAQYLTECIGENEKSCLYITSGSAALSLALQKARLKNKAVCLCHDISLSDDGCLVPAAAVSMNQDIFGQCEAAVRAAARFIDIKTFPDTKFNYIPSLLIQGD